MGDVAARGREARHSTTVKAAARVGLVAYGVVHLLVAFIALQVAWSGGGDASSGGALRAVAEQPFGRVLLGVAAAGLASLVVWQLLTAAWGHRGAKDEKHRTAKRLSELGRAVVYAALAWSAARSAAGSGTSSGSDSKEEGLTADLLGAPAGRVLVVAVAVVVLAVAARHVQRGLSTDFTHDLEAPATRGGSAPLVLAAGRTGYVGKGVAIGLVGALFGWAALTYDAEKAGGLDDALTTVREQPYGPWLLSLVAVGLAAFGLFCFAWARWVKTR